MTKLLEQLGGCAAIRAEFLKASQDARCKEGIRGLTGLKLAIRAVFSRPVFQTDLVTFFYAHLFLKRFGPKSVYISKPKIKVSDCGVSLNQTLATVMARIHNFLYLSHITDVKG